MEFYSEEDISLYREGEKHFIVHAPANASISKAMHFSITFTGQFAYQKTDENGREYDDKILYRESKVKELEDIYQEFLNKKVDQKNGEAIAACKPGEKPKKYPYTKIKRSTYADDRVIMYRDEDMHSKMAAVYRSQIGNDYVHTEEKLAKLGPEFGLIIMRTNLEKEKADPSVVYGDYKKIETHYYFVENTIKFYGLKTSDYCTMQGLSFLMITVGQIKAMFMDRMTTSASQYVKSLSIIKCLTKAARFKFVQNQDKNGAYLWRQKKKIEMLQAMGVDVARDLRSLNASQL